MVRILFHEPRIPGNTGNAIRLAAATGAELHLVAPLGFELTDTHLNRAGLDYHDLASLEVHPGLEAAWHALEPVRVIAFTTTGATRYTSIAYHTDDVLLFGCEPSGLPSNVLDDPHITHFARIPMLPSRRSLNLANSAAIAVYEAWRQLDFTSSV